MLLLPADGSVPPGRPVASSRPSPRLSALSSSTLADSGLALPDEKKAPCALPSNFGEETREAAPLGILTEFVATGLNSEFQAGVRYSALRERYRLQRTARRLLPWHRVAHCLRSVQAGGSYVGLGFNTRHHRGVFKHLQLCASPWSCPLCAAIITERRRVQLQRLCGNARTAGLRVVMVTLTFSHSRGDNLRTIVESFLGALRKLAQHRKWRELRKLYGVVGWVKALEVTHGRNGWHPHSHMLLFLPAEADAEAFGEALRALWSEALGKVGLSCNEHGFRLDDTNEAVAQYVAKYGHERTWDEAAELTKSHVKRGRGGNRSPFDLLRDAADGDTEAGSLFAEYSSVFKGRHQLQMTPGLAELLLGEAVKEDDELVTEGDGDVILLALLHGSGWRKVLAQDARAELQMAMDSGDVAEVVACLDALGVEPDQILLLDNEEGRKDA